MAPVAPKPPLSSSSSSSSAAAAAAPSSSTGGISKRTSARAKVRARLSAAAGPALPKTFRPGAVVDDGFLNSKRDKRLIKHSAFVSRIAKASGPSSSSKKRRRPSKKLVATLESLGDALDDIITNEMAGNGKGNGEAMMDAEQAAQGKVRHRSLKSRPGALKRKERVVKGEMERFGRSLAQLAMIPPAPAPAGVAEKVKGGKAESGDMEVEKQDGDGPAKSGQQQQQSATSNRWAALRGFISATMEQNPAFLKKA